MESKSRVTEQRNKASVGIDRASTIEMLRIINSEDKKVPFAVESAIDEIAYVVDSVVERFKRGGRLFYIGAGTSGRLGVLDASECPPTYGVSNKMVQGIIAGGEKALTTSIEGAEDDRSQGVSDCKERELSSDDTLIGITANGGAPYVVAALEYANSIGAYTAAISCNESTPVFDLVDERSRIYLPVGPEIVTGSTRMKSGTAQKLVLNMITTASMIKLGKVYDNLMVDLVPVNAKLIERSISMIMTITAVDRSRAEEVFYSSGNRTKVAIVMAAYDVPLEEAEKMLEGESRIGHLFESSKPKHLSSDLI